MEIKEIIAKKLIKTNETYEARLLENDENEYIAIRCNKGHLYRLSLMDPKFGRRVGNCPFCIKDKRKILDNTKYLPHNVNCLQSLVDLFDKYMYWGKDEACFDPIKNLYFRYINDLFIFQSDDSSKSPIEIFDKQYVVDKKLIDLDIRHIENLYTYSRDEYQNIIFNIIKHRLIKGQSIDEFLQADKNSRELISKRVYIKTETDSIDKYIEDLISELNINNKTHEEIIDGQKCLIKEYFYKGKDIIDLFNNLILRRQGLIDVITNTLRHITDFEVNIGLSSSEDMDSDRYYYNEDSIFTKEMMLEKKGISTPKLISRTIKIYEMQEKEKRVNHKKQKYITKEERKEIEYLLENIDCFNDQIKKLEEEFINNTRKIITQKDKIYFKINQIYGREVYKLYQPLQSNLYTWLLTTEDKELANIILNNYSDKNSKCLTEIPIDSTDTILIKGTSGSMFKTTALTITSQNKVLSRLPRGTSYPELFIYYYFKSIFPNTIHRGKAPDTRYEYDIAIPEKKLVIEYNGSAFHKGEGSFDKRETDIIKMNHALENGVKYIRIEDDGEDKVHYSDKLITYKGSTKELDTKLYEVCMLIKNKKLHNMNLKPASIEEIKRQIDLYY